MDGCDGWTDVWMDGEIEGLLDIQYMISGWKDGWISVTVESWV